jgi:predicted PurR-regulated permease PerM
VLFVLCLSVWLLRVGRSFFITLLAAVLLAFILEPLVQLFLRLRVGRGFASFLACSVMLGTVYLALLGVWSQGVGFWQDMPNYSKRVNELVDTASLQIEQAQRSVEELLLPPRLRQYQPADATTRARTTRGKKAAANAALPNAPAPVQEVRIRQDPGDLVSVVLESFGKFSDALLLASFIPFLVYFFLSWRDHLHSAFLSLAGNGAHDSLRRSLSAIADATRAYVVGNFLLGLVISIVSSIFFFFAGVPYWQVAGPLSGFLSLIPYLGLPMAALPPILAALPVYATWGHYLVICTGVAVLHLVALNLLYPKLVGARVHLNPLVVTLALMIWYVIWGGFGLIFAIPITAAMKAVFDNSPRMRGYGRLLGD